MEQEMEKESASSSDTKEIKKVPEGGRLWSDALLMQDLEDGLSGSTVVEESRVSDRGTESYKYIPDDKKRGSPSKSKFNADDNKRGSPSSKDRKRKRDGSAEGSWKRVHHDYEIDNKQSGRGGRQWKGRGRGGGWRGGGRGGTAKYVPKAMMTNSYDRTKLFDATLDPEMDDEGLAVEMADALGEKFPEVIEKAVEIAGKQVAIELFQMCQNVEKSGGMLTMDQKRRRTPGGVYLQLFKNEKRINDETKKEFFEYTARLQKERNEKSTPKMEVKEG